MHNIFTMELNAHIECACWHVFTAMGNTGER